MLESKVITLFHTGYKIEHRVGFARCSSDSVSPAVKQTEIVVVTAAVALDCIALAEV